jgi:putative ABC transport system permease protein
MSSSRFVLVMAWRETRGSRRMLLLLVAAVAAGVAALVAIRGFADTVRDSVRLQAQALLGADLVGGSARPFSPKAEEQLRRLSGDSQAQFARVISFGAMAYVPGRAGSRLVQVLAVEPGYPFYGEVRTNPPGEWGRIGDGGDSALADEALGILLDAKPGDTLSIGDERFRLTGTVRNFPGDIGVRTSLGPRVFVPFAAAQRTGLLGFGARARYEIYVRLPASADAQRLVDRFRPLLAAERLSLRTVAEDQRRLSDNLGRLGRYLGLVGLIALLLGGIGVASAVHVLVRRRLQTIAVLRCLGASSRQVLAVYLLQATGLGVVGSSLGAALGVAAQAALPRLLGDFLPVAVSAGISWPAVASGLLTGAAAALLFTLHPLLAVRRVPPLLALRRDIEPQRAALRERWIVSLAIGVGVVLIASWEAGGIVVGAAFSAGLGIALLALWLAASGLRAGLRRGLSPRLSYAWRQGLANLYRPANQTLAVALSLGFGAFLLATLLALQTNLLRDLRSGEGPRSNLAFFDIQRDQLSAVVAELKRAGVDPGRPVPIVPMRIESVKGIPASQKLAQAAAGAPQRSPAWLLRREFRSSYRADMTPTEELASGTWWTTNAAFDGGVVPVSLEVEMARDLGVAMGDEIVWDVQGVLLKSRVANLRRVEWARFEPNFFAVFPEGPLDDAPQSFVTLLNLDDPAARARVMRLLAERFPNISALDLADIQKNLEELLAKLAWAVRFLALFSVATGTLVLLGALAASRLERLREAVLLKTLGATRRQVLRVVVAEYAALGLLAGATGVLLAGAASWALVRFLFESRFTLPALPLLGFGAGVVALTLALGASSSLDVFRKTSLELLREE